MLEIPVEIQRLFKQDGIRKNFRVHFPNGECDDIINDRLLSQTVKLTESLCSDQNLVFGTYEAPSLSFECAGVDNIKGCTIETYLEIDLTTILDDHPMYESPQYSKEDLDYQVYSIPYGTFIVESCKRKTGDMTIRSVEAYSPYYFSEDNNSKMMSPVERLKWDGSIITDGQPKYVYNQFAFTYGNIPVIDMEFDVDDVVEFSHNSGGSLSNKNTAIQKTTKTVWTEYPDMGGGYWCSPEFVKLPDGKYRPKFEVFLSIAMAYIPVNQGAEEDMLYWLSFDSIKDSFRGAHDELIKMFYDCEHFTESFPGITSSKIGCYKNLQNTDNISNGIFQKSGLSYDDRLNAFLDMCEFGVYQYFSNDYVNKSILSAESPYTFMPLNGSTKYKRYPGDSESAEYVPSALGYRYVYPKIGFTNTLDAPIAYIGVPYSATIRYSSTTLNSSGVYVVNKDSMYTVQFRNWQSDYTNTINLYSIKNLPAFTTEVERKYTVTGTIITLVKKKKKKKKKKVKKEVGYSVLELSSLPNLSEYIRGILELNGMFGKFTRDGKFEVLRINDDVGLFPGNHLYPSKELLPHGGDILYDQSLYQSAWYDDESVLPYGKVTCTYQDADSTDEESKESFAEITIPKESYMTTSAFVNDAIDSDGVFYYDAMSSTAVSKVVDNMFCIHSDREYSISKVEIEFGNPNGLSGHSVLYVGDESTCNILIPTQAELNKMAGVTVTRILFIIHFDNDVFEGNAYMDLANVVSTYYEKDDEYQIYDISENVFVTNNKFTYDEITDYLSYLADNIRNIRYMPAQLTCKGLPFVEIGDFIQVLTNTGGFETLVLQRTITGIQSLTDSIESRGE